MAQQVKVVNKLPQFLDAKERAAAKAVTQGTILILTEASYRTPIDTSVLLNSYTREIEKQGSKIIGTIGNNAKYAAYVHDPNVKQTFTRSSAVKEFLKVGGDAAKPMVDKIIKGALKV